MYYDINTQEIYEGLYGNCYDEIIYDQGIIFHDEDQSDNGFDQVTIPGSDYEAWVHNPGFKERQEFDDYAEA